MPDYLSLVATIDERVVGHILFTPVTIEPPVECRIAGLAPMAVYREPDGTIHKLSAVCVHLGCVVRWNATERTWDCPCHGSRYDRFGAVINGPANSNLPPR